MSSRRGLWVADLGLGAVLIGTALIVYVIELVSDQRLRAAPRIIVGMVLAVVPVLVWLVFFLRRDRTEPEPKKLVAAVVVIAALAAGAVGEPFLRSLRDASGPFRWLAAVLVVGVVREFTKYLVVRLVAVESGEVGELGDGIIYGTAAGLGYSLALNMSFFAEAGGASLTTGFLWISVVALAHAAFGGVVGYFASADLLENKPPWWMPTGLALAAIADGVFFQTRGVLATAFSAPGASPDLASWLGLALSLMVVVGITAALSRVMRREESPA